MICPQCNQPNPEDSRFCKNCGAPLQPYPPLGGAAPAPPEQPGDASRLATPTGPNQPWIRVVLIVALILGCLCFMGVGASFLLLRNQTGSRFDRIFNKPATTPALQFPTPFAESEVIPDAPDEVFPTAEPPRSEIPPRQPDMPAKTILVSTTAGIFVVDEQTHALTQLSRAPLDAPWDLEDGRSADGKYFAYLTGWGGASVNPMLIVLDIENKTSILELELTGQAMQPSLEGSIGDPAFEASRAMRLTNSLAWSPDGTRLAFVAALDGNSTDVYLFNSRDKAVTRLTEESGHAFDLNWSPDGQLLGYLSAKSFGTGAGAVMESLWIYDFQIQQPYLLENLESGGETFLAWTDNSHFLISSWSAICENYHLRLVAAIDSNDQVIVEGCFSGIDYDPEQKHGFFAVTEFNSENCPCGEALEPGLMIFGEGIGYTYDGEIGRNKFEPLDAYTVSFVPQGSLFVIFDTDGQQFIYDRNLVNLQIPADVYQLTPHASPDNAYWAWASRSQSGLWVTLERHLKPVALSPTFRGVPLWREDGQVLYFFENNQLFSASAPDFGSKTQIAEISDVEILGLID